MPRAMLAKVCFTAVAFATLLGVLWYAADPPAPKYLMVDELAHDGFDRWQDRELKIHGWVVPSSIELVLRASDPGYSFLLRFRGALLRVFADGPRPALVADQAELVVAGWLVPDDDAPGAHALIATDINTRCARDYEHDHGPHAPAPEFK